MIVLSQKRAKLPKIDISFYYCFASDYGSIQNNITMENNFDYKKSYDLKTDLCPYKAPCPSCCPMPNGKTGSFTRALLNSLYLRNS